MNPQPISRRSILRATAFAAASLLAPIASSQVRATAKDGAVDIAIDGDYWRAIAADFDLDTRYANLENGFWGVMSRPVLERYVEHTEMVNRANSYYARRAYYDDYPKIVARVADALGAQPDEIALTRNATEALQNLIENYRGLQQGAAVMYADLDYDAMQRTMDWVAKRAAGKVIRLEIPEPVAHDELVEFYVNALQKHPDVRLLLLTHISHRTGLLVPVREITERARALDVDVIVDAAHSWGQLDFQVDTLGADFVGFNLHKWIGAPLGVGAMYIKRQRLGDMALNPGAYAEERTEITGRVHTGTVNFAAQLSAPDALDYHEYVGRQNKEARLRYLRDYWVAAARGIRKLDILTPDDSRMHGGITSFRFQNVTDVPGNKAIVERLLKDHGVLTVHRAGVAKGACVRVTPAIYNSTADCDRLVKGLQALAQSI
ncbi:MAG TPA: aminotransferase class V-fold PLP-dependent enzyme [Woeseiaceae bacterium]|nr:aminotransferase class V-fold PLP-dependent enzyme [Woeseiaceae bacterium]